MQTVSSWGSSVSGWVAPIGQWVSGNKTTPIPAPPPAPVVVLAPHPTPSQTAARIAVGALAAVGSVALVGAALHRWGPRPFPRGLQSRSRASAPFEGEGGACPFPSVANHFYKPDQFQFIRLSQGRVRYILRSGAAAGSSTDASSASDTSPSAPSPPHTSGTVASSSRRVVVLVHGFSIAADIWKQQADYLVSRGFTVLSFDNYGRGWSDAPDPETTAFDYRLYVAQLAELLFALDIHGPVDLCGVSMGGSIVTHFAAVYPEKVGRLCLVCPAGLPIGASATFSGVMSLPVLGALAFKRAVAHMQSMGAAAQWEQRDSDAYHAWHAYAAQNVATHPGFVRTLHRTVLEYPMDDQRANYALLAQHRRPVLLIWGERDGLTPYRNAALLHDLLPGSQLVTVVGAKHNLLIERAQPVAEVMAAWLTDSQKPLPPRVHTTLHDQGQVEGEGQ